MDYFSPKHHLEMELPLHLIDIDPNNERQTMNEVSFNGLVQSVRRKGVITTIGVELTGNNKYRAVYGNRRIIAARANGLQAIRARVYEILTEEQRFRMQVAENVTKEEIPKPEMAENLWRYYHYLIERESGGKYTVERLRKYTSYEQLPAGARKVYSLTEFSRRVGCSDWRIRMAFQYVNLHLDIKKMVLDEKTDVSYSFAQEVGRIEAREIQLDYFRMVLAGRKDMNNPARITNRDQLSLAVTKYIKELGQKAPFAMEICSALPDGSLSDFECEILQANRILGNLELLLEIDSGLKEAASNLYGNWLTLSEMFTKGRKDIQALEQTLQVQPQYASAAASVNRRVRRALDEFFGGDEESINGDRTGNQDISFAKYQVVPINLLVPDPTQPRKTFKKDRLEQLAATIKDVGLLSEPLVRPLPDGKYGIVVGHRRTAACRLIEGYEEIGVLVCQMDDKTCREIQYEEDIFERVSLSERAEKLHNLYLLLNRQRLSQGKEPLSVREFAKAEKSLGTEVIVDALRFASLPYKVKRMHMQGLLHHSTAVAIAKEWENECKEKGRKTRQPDGKTHGDEPNAEEKEEWCIGWAVEASLLEYNARKLREKVFTARYQYDFEDFVPGVLGGDESRTEGRRQFAARQVHGTLRFILQTTDKVKSDGRLPKETLEMIIRLIQTFRKTDCLFTDIFT